MTYDFDAEFDRRNTESIKWDQCADFGNADALPMWVADMDFPTCDKVIKRMSDRVAHGAFGYTEIGDRDKAALINWYKRRHGLEISGDDIIFSPGVVDSINHIIDVLFEKGSRVVIQTPVYGPFMNTPRSLGMEIVENPLKRSFSSWEMDFDDLEAKLSAGAEAMILCSPHNPIGRIWTAEEIKKVCELCEKYGVLLICDEIHCDFELDNIGKHKSILSLTNYDKVIQLVSATKSFNLAALRHSAILCRNASIREKIAARMGKVNPEPNLFGVLATRAAYEEGDEWMNEINAYLAKGRDILEKGILETGKLVPTHTQGTYLMWVDCRALKLDNDALKEFFIKTVGIIPSEGAYFGSCGNGFVRLNFATRHANIEEAVRRIQKAVK